MSFPGMNFKEIADVGKKTFEFPKELKSKPMFEKELPVKVNETESEKVEDTYFSTYEERLRQAPRGDDERGHWDGVRGESMFIPSDEGIKSLLGGYMKDGVSYQNAIPDFSFCSACSVKIDNMTDSRSSNFLQCDVSCAQKWNDCKFDGRNDWTARDVKNWRKSNGYSWHERNDMTTCDLVPTKVNDCFGHLGGVSECRKRDSMQINGGDFDE